MLAIFQDDWISTFHVKDSPWNVLAHWLKYLYSIISFAAYFPVPAVTCTFFCHSVPFLSFSEAIDHQKSIIWWYRGTIAKARVKTKEPVATAEPFIFVWWSVSFCHCLGMREFVCMCVGEFGGGCIFFSIYFPAHVSLTVRFLYVLKSVAILACESGHLC